MPSHYDRVPTQQEAVIKFAEDEGLPKEATRALLNMSEKQQRAFMAKARETTTKDLTAEDFRSLLNLEDEPRRGILTTQRKPPPLAKQAYGGLMKAKKMRGGGMAGKKPRVGNMDYRKGGMVYSTKVKRG